MKRFREAVAENTDTNCDDCEYSELEAALSEQPEATLDGQGEAVDWGEWMDRFAETCDRSADALGWIHLADGRVFGSRELFLAITSKIPPTQPEAQGRAGRWRHARKLLTIDDIEGAQGAFDSFGGMVSEEECARADAAIDAAKGASHEP